VADVFLSYARPDEAHAHRLSAVLNALGWTVWWDRQLAPGVDYHREIADQLDAAKCIIVFWSRHSVDSDTVTEEADAARVRNVFLPVLVEHVTPPLGFQQFQHVDLSRWQGDIHDPEFQKLQSALERFASHRPRSKQPASSVTALAPETRKVDHKSSVFVCHRREDTQDAAGRLHDRLVIAYGRERVFMDIDSVPLGIDFVDHVTEQIGKCNLVIVMIGKQWRTIKDKKRRRRLDNEDDLVRAEIRAALQQKIPVIPVTVQNAAMPQAEDLPGDIRLLARRNGIDLSATRWTTDVERLIKELDRVMNKDAEASR
jgi:hypothetical protein